MIGQHPITGKEIRIINTETHLYRDKKTLVWLRDQEPNPRYVRWETLVTSASDLSKWKTILKESPTLFVCNSLDIAEVRELLDSKRLDDVHLMFFRRDVLMEYGKENLKKNGYQNIICIEEIHTMYPHTYMKWSSETTLDEIVLSVALLFRLHQVFGFTKQELLNLTAYKSRIEHLKLTIGGVNNAPQELWLIQQYFKPSNQKREKEINLCLKKNLECPYIDKVILLNEEGYSKRLPSHSKLKEVILGHRLTYWDVMQYITKDVPNGIIVGFANSDIFLDETWKLIWSINLEDKFLSLLRYDTAPNEEPKLFGPRPDSQDTWLVTSTSLKKRTLKKEDFDFEFGRAGCDNALNLSMLRNKFVVCNPALSLRTHHVHTSGIRTYDPKDIIDKPMYLYLQPTGLHDMQPLSDLKQYDQPFTQSLPFSRRVHGDRKELRTLTTMLSKEGVFVMDPDEENRWFPAVKDIEAVYKIPMATQTHTGLVYDSSKIYLGESDVLRLAWSKFELSQLTPSLTISKSVAVLCDDEIVNNPYRYIHDYLSKVMRMRDEKYTGEFWVPRNEAKAFENILRQFGWEDETIPIMPRTKEIQAYSETVYMLSTTSCPGSTKEEITALRKRLRSWNLNPLEEKRAVILQDDEFYDVKDSYSIEAVLEEAGYITTVVYPSRTSFDRLLLSMCGVSLCVSSLTKKSSDHYLYWLLPKGAKVIEGQMELEPMGEGIHEAGAAELDYWFYSMPRGKKDLVRPILLEKIKKILDMMNSSESPAKDTTSAPLLLLPSQKEGFHAHQGDSFRELAEMWAERGYVTLERSATTDFCWLFGKGEILLYDRPNYDWYSSSEESANYRMALVGNPKPMNDQPMRDWTFWPRKPRLLEEVAKNTNSYDAREKLCVFYGKIENTVQESNRSKLWAEACDDYCMVEGDKPYKFTHEEYLLALGNSKFGLCLAGFGNKCHREIECMAMGTVLICSPEVDMDSYANSLEEGVHYFRVKNPTEARVISETTTAADWKKMSSACRAWWLANASCDGSWELTKRLVNA